jgi:ferric iron reductase protein FhuF
MSMYSNCYKCALVLPYYLIIIDQKQELRKVELNMHAAGCEEYIWKEIHDLV